MADEQQQQAPPPPVEKRDKKRSYTVEEKLAIVHAAKSESLRAVAKRFNVDRNCIRAWRDKESQLAELHPNARRLPGAGRRPSTGEKTPKRKADGEEVDASAASATAALKADTSSSETTVGTTATEATAAGAASTTNGADAASPETTTASHKKIKKGAVQDFSLIGFQGKEGAFSDVAARIAFEELRLAKALTPSDFETVGYAHVAQVVDAIERGEIEYGVLPVENSISGTFHGNLDRLISSPLKIVGEVTCVEEYCLCALPDTKLEEIHCLLSHPVVLENCEPFVANLEKQLGGEIDRQATWDSAGACQIVKYEAMKSLAAVASEQAAIAHGLVVLEKGIGAELHNETRYMILGRSDVAVLPLGVRGPGAKFKSSIVIAVPNEPQALFKIVAAFALRNVMIVKIESRPAATAGQLFTSQTHHWDYIFYIDFITSTDASINDRLRHHLEEFALWVKDVGTYACSGVKTNVEPPRWKTLCNVISC